MFQCPNCHTDVPVSKFLIVQNNRTIQCRQCSALLKPDSDTTRRIRLWGSLILGVFAVIGYQLAGIIGAAVTTLLAYAVMAIITIRTVRFYIIE